jgi:hypothetical protein
MKRWYKRPGRQAQATVRRNPQLGGQTAQPRNSDSEAVSYARAIAARHVTVTGIAPIAALGLMLAAGPAQAAVINVTAGAVDDTVNGNCSLVEAINSANGNTAVDACTAGDDGTDGGDTIVLPSGSVFTLTSGLPFITSTVTIDGNGSTIQRSSAPGTEDFPVLVNDGGDLTVEDTTLRNGRYDAGGGIFSVSGALTLTNCTVTGNTAIGTEGGGGGISVFNGTVTLTNTTVSDNTAIEDGGGILSKYSEVILRNSTVSGNTAFDDGGGFFNSSSIFALYDSTVSDNKSYSDGGGFRNVNEDKYSIVALINSTVTGNTATSDGGGFFNGGTDTAVVLKYSTVSDNTASYGGGGISNIYQGVVALFNSTVSGNLSAGSEGGGGGISNYGTGASIEGKYSTISGNTAIIRGGGIFGGYSSSITLANSTISGNTAYQSGGGVYGSQASVTLINSTVTGNSGNGTGGIHTNYGTRTLYESIVANQASGGDCISYESGLMQRDSLDSDTSCGASITDDPLLLPLAFNGGATQTHALCTGAGTPDEACTDASPALDVGDGCDESKDQRGVARPQGADCDIGAYEALPAGTAFDFGDAPDPPYPTMLSSGGPQHILVEGFMLGTTVTEETDSLPSDSGDDGVTIPSQLVAGSSIMLNVTVADSAMGCEGSSCRLDAWVDFNGDGDWSDEGEQIAEDMTMAVGTNAVAVEVPATLGTSIAARFRLSRSGGLFPTGLASDGEVEDYVVNAPSSGGGGGDHDDCDSWELFGWCTGIGAADHWTLLLVGLWGLWYRFRHGENDEAG